MKLHFLGLLTVITTFPDQVHARRWWWQQGENVPSCADQWDCLSFTTTVVDEALCKSNNGACKLRVCMEIDTEKDGCKKEGSTIEHVCDTADMHGCPNTGEMDVYRFETSDCKFCEQGTTLGDGSVEAAGKCPGVSKLTLCQEAEPGDTLYFIVKDDSEEGDWDRQVFQQGECEPTISCFNAASEYSREEIPVSWNTQSCNYGYATQHLERIWEFKVPSVAGCAGCPTDSPSVNPSAAPTDLPSVNPSAAPTDLPTVNPSAAPTLSPTAAPVSPTDAPVNPTDAPVSPTDAPVSPTSPPNGNFEDGTLPPVQPPSGSHGDPHFKTWKNERFEYHGQCDMVLVKDEKFADGIGLDVQIRTKIIRFWSLIQSAAIRIGNDVLEVKGNLDVEKEGLSYWYNMVYQEKMETIGGFPVTIDKGTVKTSYTIDLSSKYPGQKIHISTYMEFVRIDFVNANEESFGNSVGLLGNYTTGKTLARDGNTVINDFWELGNEWQVMPFEHMLFHDVSEPQFPQRCILPEDPRGERRRQLSELTVTEAQAEAACAHLEDEGERRDCVYDIVATQDLQMVGAY